MYYLIFQYIHKVRHPLPYFSNLFLLFCPACSQSTEYAIYLAFFMVFQWMKVACRSYFWYYHTCLWVYSFNYFIIPLTHRSQKKTQGQVFLADCFYSFRTTNQKVLVGFSKTLSGMGGVN